MPSSTYKFSEFADLILVRLYDLDRENSDSFIDLCEVVHDLKGEVPESWTVDAARILQSRRLAQCLINSRGVFAQITGEGRVFVEKGEGFVGEVVRNRSNYYSIHVAGDGNQVVTGQQSGGITQKIVIHAGKGTWDHLLNSIEQKIHDDGTLGQDEKERAIGYVKVVRGELKKEEPNRTILAAILDPLSQIVSVAGQVASLIRAFNC